MAPNNSLPIHGNDKTMNLNSLILTNIQSSPYFKVNLYELKTYHEVIDEIYYKVAHLEPWEKGSRKTAGQTGMCGGVRGVGAGGIVSSAFCLLYKLFTLKLTRKQVLGLCTHTDSPYIRALGYMYIRYTQPPQDLWDWYEPYLDDEEEIDVKAGEGHTMMIGEMLRQWLTKIEWYSTLFPRIPVPVQKDIASKLKAREGSSYQGPVAKASIAVEVTIPAKGASPVPSRSQDYNQDGDAHFGEAERISKLRNRSGSPERQTGGAIDRRGGRSSPPFDIAREIEREKERQHKDSDRIHSHDRPRRSRSRDRIDHYRSREKRRSRSRERRRSRERQRSASRERRERKRARSGERRRSKSRERRRSGSRERRRRSKSRERKHKHRRRSRSRERGHHRAGSFEHDLKKERERQGKDRIKNGE